MSETAEDVIGWDWLSKSYPVYAVEYMRGYHQGRVDKNGSTEDAEYIFDAYGGDHEELDDHIRLMEDTGQLGIELERAGYK